MRFVFGAYLERSGIDLVCGSGQQKTGPGTGSAGDEKKTGNESNENFKAAL